MKVRPFVRLLKPRSGSIFRVGLATGATGSAGAQKKEEYFLMSASMIETLFLILWKAACDRDRYEHPCLRTPGRDSIPPAGEAASAKSCARGSAVGPSLGLRLRISSSSHASSSVRPAYASRCRSGRSPVAARSAFPRFVGRRRVTSRSDAASAGFVARHRQPRS
jgi:hypothetical protein